MTSDLKEYRNRKFGSLRVTDRDGNLVVVPEGSQPIVGTYD